MRAYVARDRPRFNAALTRYRTILKDRGRMYRLYRDLIGQGVSHLEAKRTVGKFPRVPPRPLPLVTHDLLYMVLNALFPTCDRAVPSIEEGAFQCYAKLLSTGQMLPCRVYPEWVPREFTLPYRAATEAAEAGVAETVMAQEHGEVELCYRVHIDGGAEFVSPGQALTLYRLAKLPYDQTAATWEFSEFQLEEKSKRDPNQRSNVVRGTDRRVGEETRFDCPGSGTVFF